ncbi:glutamyl-tRNA(Gln) amidotransferase subunit HER2 [Aspergillus fischeri NRRL 181]|uniref:Glutamyl-tRNA(Gln) amidotransferase subunit A, mitochondrial n=1 Tax=Neosartorya fischeri (strain ATCC 1020 / DSM 3700 / CBS 544.65 / FGSC A1164 / JCM 1740 / NRRL 181 / WB 181) TaxID=331117 RepID=A1DKN6_NEOFI|nr:glutamyl-tRNA amidotransferase, A subunit, putative [Aspergillus fischeri NRRL 181]EAW17275.1 glutamyl-tRNA amidotransferase, A subunit, putative [Aspergillus fischeri NRRL 181]
MSLLREAEKCITNQRSHAALNAFITTVQHSGPWREQVRDAEVRRESGKSKSEVDGRLIAFKDNICTRDFPTTCASGILAKFASPFNATVVEQLSEAGAIVAGKTNLDEFGMGSHSLNSWFGPVKNQRQYQEGRILSAGGSSGGSAVSVATDQCYAALGTDTGGSVRLPAAYTGTVGFKPSYGLVSRWGVVAYANSLDTVGILAKNASTARDVFPSHLQQPALLSRMTSSLRIGVPIEYNISELSPSVRRAWALSIAFLREQGHTIHPVSLPTTKLALSAYYVLAPAEASSNLAKYDGIRYGSRCDGPDSGGQPDSYLYAKTRGDGFGPEVKRRILLGAFSLSADAINNYFIQAQRVRRLVQRDFNAVFRAEQPMAPSRLKGDAELKSKQAEVDVLICPTAPSCPPQLADLVETDSIFSSLNAYTNDVFTVPASLAGLPAASVPVSVDCWDEGSSDADLAGIQIIGQYGDDELVLKVSEILEGKKF